MEDQGPGPDDWITNATWDSLDRLDSRVPGLYHAALAVCQELAALRHDLRAVRRGERAASLMLRQMVAECEDPETECVQPETLKAAQKLLDE